MTIGAGKKLRLGSLLCALLLLVTGCGLWNTQAPLPAPGTQTETVTLWFVAADAAQTGEFFYTEQQQISYTQQDSLPQLVLERLFAGPQATELGENVIPQGMSIQQVFQVNDLLLVTLNDEQAAQEDLQPLLIRSAVALTMLELPGVFRVGVYFNQMSFDGAGNPADLFRSDKLILDGMNWEGEGKDVALYFPDLENRALKQQTRTIYLERDELLQNAIVQEMLNGPSEAGLVGTVTNPVEVTSCYVSGTVCYLNFSGALFSPNDTDERKVLGLYALVDSLCTDGVLRVEIRVNGALLEDYRRFAGGEDLFRYRSDPLELIATEEETT